MNTYRVTYITPDHIRSFNIEVNNVDNIINIINNKIKTLGENIKTVEISSVHVIECEGCKIEAPGQVDHMGHGGCLS